MQHVIDDLAARLRRSVVIDDPAVRMLWASRHYGDEDRVRTQAMLQRRTPPEAVGHVLAQGVTSWTTAGMVPPNPELGMHARVCVPVRWRGELLGLLMVVDADGSITTSELATISAVADELSALVFGVREPAVDREVLDREAALEDLFDDEPAVRRAAVPTLTAAGRRPPEHVRVLHLQVREGAESPAHVVAALRHAVEVRETTPAGVSASAVVRERWAAVLLGSSRPVPEAVVAGWAERLLADVDQIAAGRFEAVAGIGSEVDGLDAAWTSHRQAGLAVRAARSVRPGRVVAWAGLGAQALVLRLPLAEIGPETMPAELQRLLAVDRDGRLVETVRALLEHGGDMPATAAALHVHRTTLYYRLDRVRQLADLDLGDGATRLVLHLGLVVLDAVAATAGVFDNGRNPTRRSPSGSGGEPSRP